MLTITKRIADKPVTLELYGTPIGKTFAKNLPAADLYSEMSKLGITDISPNMGWMDLATRLAEWNYIRRESADGFGDVTRHLPTRRESAA